MCFRAEKVLRSLLRIPSPTWGLNSRLLIKYARMSFGWFIYTLASMNFFRHFTVKGSPCLLRGSLACMFSGLLIWMQYLKSVCGKKMCLRTEISCIPREIKGTETVFTLILSEKNWFPTETIHQLSINDVKMLLLIGKIRKAYKVRNLFCSHD